jgi:peptide-methionine (S)-S-oxide reductase
MLRTKIQVRTVSRIFLTGLIATLGLNAASLPSPTVDENKPGGRSETVVLAGGCFWGMEAVFESLKGVSDVVSGYSGGSKANAEYELVSTGTTGHAESVLITYSPSQISLGTILKVYFSVAHDPTQLNRQDPDEGPQYRSAIFYANDEQKRIAEAYIKQLTDAKVFSKPIVTKLTPLQAFYRAEEYHQDFIKKNPHQGYIVRFDLPKLAALKKEYPELVK